MTSEICSVLSIRANSLKTPFLKILSDIIIQQVNVRWPSRTHYYFFKILSFKNGVMISYRCGIVICDINIRSEILVEGAVLVSDYRSHLPLKPGFSCHF